MVCKYCGKESKEEICHNCKILQKKKSLTESEMIRYFHKPNIIEIKSINDLSSKILVNTDKVKFICKNCNKEYTGIFKNIKNKTELLCAQCTLEKNNLQKYGKKNIFETDQCKNKIKETCKKNYGVDYYLQSTEARDKLKQQQFNIAKDVLIKKLENYSNFTLQDTSIRPKDNNGHYYFAKVNCICKKCGNSYTTNIRRAQRCNICYPEDWLNGTSKTEKAIVEYIKSIYNGDIIENSKSIIPPKELDIFLPELNIAIEYDGDYWHGCNDITFFKEDLKRAGEKQELCEQKGIRLITIKECDYLDRPDIFNKFIADTILPRKRIFARQCKIELIDKNTAENFCKSYHVNGYRNGSIRYGLYYNTDLVCVAVFGKHPKYDWECIRLCYKTGISIIGGWEKIQKHFGKRFLHFVNLQYFPGKNVTGIGFRYKKDDIILSRRTLQKNEQLKKYCENYDPNKSDIENCINNGFTIIFDCGNDKRIYN